MTDRNLDADALTMYITEFMEKYSLSELEDLLVLEDTSTFKQGVANKHTLLLSELNLIVSQSVSEKMMDNLLEEANNGNQG